MVVDDSAVVAVSYRVVFGGRAIGDRDLESVYGITESVIESAGRRKRE